MSGLVYKMKQLYQTSRATSVSANALVETVFEHAFRSLTALTFGLREERDVQPKVGKLYLLKTAVSSKNSALNSAKDDGEINLWSLVLHYQEAGFYLKMNAGCHGGLLMPGYQKSFDAPAGDLFTLDDNLFDDHHIYEVSNPFVYLVGDVRRGSLPTIDQITISPAEFREIARRNTLNGAIYLNPFNDSQSWVVASAMALTRYRHH